ncbi:DUF5683 domain-containing protein [Mucilaginibacter sp. cycad4]|uniref:DUF5683 domain-containing protein n=1 Tax=Mucilaginibacter sp. cycad4 TaxID=3342096 RepID=UPI002AAABFE0|nr:DUF5683 domain-containing protein [Mucilaginibacter gossypii]WPU99937.1 DUF5683 domain-containing protein [Mucilaginibacter gossypii]
MYKYLFFLVVSAFFISAAQAQVVDSTGSKKSDTLKVKHPVKTPSGSFAPKIDPAKEKIYHPDSTHIPHKAVIHSLMIPGWGQVYNHRWWKVPLIYGGLGLLTSAIIYNQHYYKEYLTLSRYRQGTPPNPGDPYYTEYNLYKDVPDANLSDARENSRRNRDLSILGFLAVWGIQAVDAYIDAKFIHSYTVDNNLSFKVAPGIINQPVYAQGANYTYIPGIKVTFTF